MDTLLSPGFDKPKQRYREMRILVVLVLTFFTISTAMAHSGRTDRCGGHNDRKRGGYHVHDKTKYCACNPDAEICKENK